MTAFNQICIEVMEPLRCTLDDTNESHVPRLTHFDWRIDIEIGTRFLKNRPKAIATVQFVTESPDFTFVNTDRPKFAAARKVSVHNFRLDFMHLKKLEAVLEEALDASNGKQCNRVMKYL